MDDTVQVVEDTIVSDQSNAQSSAELIEYYIRTLTSEEFAGRMPGTHGNDLALEWLSEMLANLGVEPYFDGGFKMAYEGWSNTFIRSQMSMIFPDGSNRILEQGIDFFVSLGEGSFSVAIDSDGDNFTVLARDESRGVRITDPAAEYFIYFVSNGSFWNSAGSQSTDRAFKDKQVQLSEEIYTIIQNGDFDRIAITNTVSYEKMELYHVIGRISGANSDNAVVISAHFDHVGEGGSTFFPGALDNASGTAAVLYIAERLVAVSETHTFDFDIIIALFNSEEHSHNGRPLGSQYFMPIIMADYENIWNINIDCIGSSPNEVFHTDMSGSSALREAFTNFANQHDIAVDNNQTALSDNINFVAMGIPSFNFISGDFMTSGIAHTNLDTADRLYFSQIVRVSDMIIEFLMQDGVSVFEFDEDISILSDVRGMDSSEMDQEAILNDIISSLRNGEEVRFYDEFFSSFTNHEQNLFSYSEAIYFDERLSHFNDFGESRLMFISFSHGIDMPPSIVYTRNWRGEQLDFSIRSLQTDELDAHIERIQVEIVDISELNNFYALYCPDQSRVRAFLYNDGSYIFTINHAIFSALIHSELGAMIFSFVDPGQVTSELDDYIELVQSMQFDEFVTMWSNAFG